MKLPIHEHAIKYPVKKVSVHLTSYEQDRLNPLFINQTTGLCVLKPSYIVTKPHTEKAQCLPCEQQQTIERWQTKRYQLTRTQCQCKPALTLYPINPGTN